MEISDFHTAGVLCVAGAVGGRAAAFLGCYEATRESPMEIVRTASFYYNIYMESSQSEVGNINCLRTREGKSS